MTDAPTGDARRQADDRPERTCVRVLFFAACREWTQQDEVELELADQSTVHDLLDVLEGRFEILQKARGTLAVAVNEEYARADTTLCHGDVVALLPPMSGGSR